MGVEALRSVYLNRIDKLLTKVEKPKKLGKADDRATVDAVLAGTINLVSSLYGAGSPQAKALLEMHKHSNAKDYDTEWLIESFAQSLKGVLANMKEELDAGLITRIFDRAAGEVIGDMLALAKEQLKGGYKDVAAVLACAALEDALKRKARELGIAVENRKLDNVVNALKSKAFLKGAQAPLVASYVKLRNAAMHADWTKIQDSDVSSLIGFLEPFLLEHFS